MGSGLTSISKSQTQHSTAMLSLLFFSILQLVLVAAWVSGYLDAYQKRLQEIILDAMGETKVSYGLKSK